MRRHWQRRPLLVRQAFADWRAPMGSDAVRRLATRDDVQSRLVTAIDGQWRLAHGPFSPTRIPSARRADWTLLVQGVDRLDDRVHALLEPFRFLSDARLDDVMISIAGDGGGVGPHVDSYDVFLIQAEGRRRWRTGPTPRSARGAPALIEGLPLKILADFQPDDEWIVEPGDMLYLPPGWAHEGVALGACMTISIGFRAPSRREFLRAWLAECADDPGGADPRFGDAGTAATTTPAALPPGLVTTLRGWAAGWRPDDTQLDRFIGRYLTEPHPDVWFEGTAEGIGDDESGNDGSRPAGDGADGGMPPSCVRLDRRSRAAYRGRDFFLNGECFAGAASASLKSLADRRSLEGQVLQRAWRRPAERALLIEWLQSGWLTARPDCDECAT